MAKLKFLGTAYGAGCVPLPGYEEIVATVPDGTIITSIQQVSDTYCSSGSGYPIVHTSNGNFGGPGGTLWSLPVSAVVVDDPKQYDCINGQCREASV